MAERGLRAQTAGRSSDHHREHHQQSPQVLVLSANSVRRTVSKMHAGRAAGELTDGSLS